MSTLSQDYPRLASFALSTNVSVKVIMNAENLDDIFLLLISQQAYEEFQHLQLASRICHMMIVPCIIGYQGAGTPHAVFAVISSMT
jgi:hypothetical protein